MGCLMTGVFLIVGFLACGIAFGHEPRSKAGALVLIFAIVFLAWLLSYPFRFFSWLVEKGQEAEKERRAKKINRK
jgi:multisubunit Na+/H+ antiporter MnhB subunit